MFELFFSMGAGVLALLFGLFLSKKILALKTGTEKMQNIAAFILEGAKAYLNRQYQVISVLALIIFIILSFALGLYVGIGFIIGAILSGLSGFVGMHISVRANVRTTEAARTGLKEALEVSFKSGAVTGLLVVGLAILGLSGYYFVLMGLDISFRMQLEGLVALGFGASLISIFARLGGGIFTKGADVGADMVGKIEADIPEDDPRNPAVIADNVGDNVGDCAGMAADLFETYIVTMVGTMLLAGVYFTGITRSYMMLLPLLIGGACVITTILGTFFVRLSKNNDIMGALYKGFLANIILSGIAVFLIIYLWLGFDAVIEGVGMIFTGANLFVCAITGLIVTILLMWITEYYTSTKSRPVKKIAQASVSGHGTNIIQGLAISMEATAMPVIVICMGILVSYNQAGLFGIAVAASAMLAVAGMIVALDAYGPVTDNAGGIAEMSGLPEDIRKTTDALDAVGNTTKAVTKGYAIGSAGFAALVLFSAFIEDLNYYFPSIKVNFMLNDAYTLVGLLLGGLLPYLFGALCLEAVGVAAQSVVLEVRRQFKDNGIMSGKTKPNYKNAVDILTKTAIKEMIVPSLLPVFAPLVVYLVIDITVGQQEAFTALGSMLLGIVITGLFVGLSMTTGGGAWDNAKKLIEDGAYGGKGSMAHKASITGDTVGDPYKDTAGPAINPMIKIANIVALLLLSTLSKFENTEKPTIEIQIQE
jgi:K(+)-stimulated pyrophosphate-energized sodium pump